MSLTRCGDLTSDLSLSGLHSIWKLRRLQVSSLEPTLSCNDKLRLPRSAPKQGFGLEVIQPETHPWVLALPIAPLGDLEQVLFPLWASVAHQNNEGWGQVFSDDSSYSVICQVRDCMSWIGRAAALATWVTYLRSQLMAPLVPGWVTPPCL